MTSVHDEQKFEISHVFSSSETWVFLSHALILRFKRFIKLKIYRQLVFLLWSTHLRRGVVDITSLACMSG